MPKTKEVTFSNVLAQISRNGNVRQAQQPTKAQLSYLAALIVDGVKSGKVRWEMGDGSWSGRTGWQVSGMINSIKNG